MDKASKEDDSFSMLDFSGLDEFVVEKENQPAIRENENIAVPFKQNLSTNNQRQSLVERTNFMQENNTFTQAATTTVVATNSANQMSVRELIMREQHLIAREIEREQENSRNRHEARMQVFKLMEEFK